VSTLDPDLILNVTYIDDVLFYVISRQNQPIPVVVGFLDYFIDEWLDSLLETASTDQNQPKMGFYDHN
jgi:hypothetical protein